MTVEEATQLLQAEFGLTVTGEDPKRVDPLHLVATGPNEQWVEVARFVKERLGCRYFVHLTAVDWKADGFEVVCRLENLEAGLGLTLKTRLGTGTSCPSLTGLFRGADWMERECYDLFGIRFEGHPDLRRILLDQDWQGFPLRKDYAVDTAHEPYR